MNPAELLGKTFDCECGKTHSVGIREVVYETEYQFGEQTRRLLASANIVCRQI